ncbi:MAG: hypothetical protein ABIJ86_06580, partial [Spirochaetota bacterium]
RMVPVEKAPGIIVFPIKGTSKPAAGKARTASLRGKPAAVHDGTGLGGNARRVIKALLKSSSPADNSKTARAKGSAMTAVIPWNEDNIMPAAKVSMKPAGRTKATATPAVVLAMRYTMGTISALGMPAKISIVYT